MKIFIIAIVLVGLVMPVFAQDANAPLYKSLNDSMNGTISYGSGALQNFDKNITNNDQGKAYAVYKVRYEALTKALNESETRLDRLLYFHDTPANVRAERNRFESLLKQIQAVQAEYDNWLKSVQ